MDPYKTLGVGRNATQQDIKKAYRKLAKDLHPDLHPNDTAKQDRFKAVSAAYDLLGDPEKRRRFDAGEIDENGQERQFHHEYAGHAGAGAGAGGFASTMNEDDLSDIFAQFFGGRSAHRGAGFGAEFQMRGQDLRYHLDVDFVDAALGAKRKVTMPDGNAIEITIPAGVRDGQTLRLRGKGGQGLGRGPRGDALVTVSVRTHPLFTRDGTDIHMELPITFDEAVLGGKVDVPTLRGPVSLTIPKGSSSRRKLRLRGKGIRGGSGTPGDQIVTLKIVLPKTVDRNMEELARQWRRASSFDPRAGLQATA